MPRLVLQGTRDSFGSPEEVRAATVEDPGVLVVDLPGADHGYRLPAGGSTADLRGRLVAEAARLLAVGGSPADRTPGNSAGPPALYPAWR